MSEQAYVPDTTFCVHLSAEPQPGSSLSPDGWLKWKWALYAHPLLQAQNHQWRKVPHLQRAGNHEKGWVRESLTGMGITVREVEYLECAWGWVPLRGRAEQLYDRIKAAWGGGPSRFNVCIHGYDADGYTEGRELRWWYGTPADDPAIKGEDRWSVVNTDNFGGDYPNEYFVAQRLSRAEAERVATRLNAGFNPDDTRPSRIDDPRYHKVVPADYVLVGGFEP